MNNQHNPIAQRINYLQQFWMQQRVLEPEAQFVRWMIEESDLPLVNGFYKLESSIHGKIEETIVVMLTDFEKPETFSFQLAKDWLQAYKKDAEKHPELQWKDYQELQSTFDALDEQDNQVATSFLVELLTKFKEYENKKTVLYVGINPRKVSSHDALCVWICNGIQQLPKNIGIVVTDYKKAGYFEPVFENEDVSFKKQSLVLKDQDMQGAYSAIMTQGNPNDPQVAFRKCMVKMGEAANNNDEAALVEWGEKGLDITKKTDNLVFWASAHLMYAGFLFGFKNSERIIELLDKGIEIGSKDEKDQNLISVTLQLYGYKAAYFSIIGDAENASNWFIKQAGLALTNHQDLVALTAYKNALIILHQNRKDEQIEEIVLRAFNHGITMPEDTLRTTEFAYVAKHYIDILRKDNVNRVHEKQIEEIENRMIHIFGDQWELQGNELWEKAKVANEVTS